MFVAATGLHYRDFLAALHQQLRFGWYLEIGSQTGRSLAKSRSPSIAVDPAFRIKYDVAGKKPQLHLFQQTSDDFFAAGQLKTLKARPDFSFLDGMPLFEYLLRDFINTERAGSATSVIALHDCCPFGHAMTTRHLDNIPPGAWTGDVWKLIPILQEYRPDLTVQVLDCAPTGLVVVSNLKPQNRVLARNYDRIVSQYRDLSLADFGVERFFASFPYTDARALAHDGFQPFRPACREYLPADRMLIAAAPQTTPAEPVTLKKITAHGVDPYSGHRAVRNLSHDLAGPLSQPLDVYIGNHAVDRPVDTGRFRIGIQTEQFLDSAGKPLLCKPLSPPLQQGQHNFDLAAAPTRATTEAPFRNLADLAANHNFHVLPQIAQAESGLRRTG